MSSPMNAENTCTSTAQYSPTAIQKQGYRHKDIALSSKSGFTLCGFCLRSVRAKPRTWSQVVELRN